MGVVKEISFTSDLMFNGARAIYSSKDSDKTGADAVSAEQFLGFRLETEKGPEFTKQMFISNSAGKKTLGVIKKFLELSDILEDVKKGSTESSKKSLAKFENISKGANFGTGQTRAIVVTFQRIMKSKLNGAVVAGRIATQALQVTHAIAKDVIKNQPKATT